MPKPKWIMLIASCLMIAGGIFYWQNAEQEAGAPEAVRAISEEEEWIVATEPLMVNINTADASELTRLPGIGPAKAAIIIRFRSENGLFETEEDIMKVPGIKDGTFARIRDYITVGGADGV